MAASISRLGCTALRHTSRIPARRKQFALSLQTCHFHTTPIHHTQNDNSDTPPSSKAARKLFKFSPKDLAPDDLSRYTSLSPSDREQWRREAHQLHDFMTSPEVESELQGAVSQLAYETSEQMPHTEVSIPRIKPGLMAMGEAEEQESGEDEEFEGDDLTSLGHGELEQHREMREYARIAAWEMPLLSKLAKPFAPPAMDEPLRFRYTTYMGETHPAQKKIVVEFCTRDLRDLTEAQRIKLVKLVGPRYNPETDIVKMSSEMFETQAQNKRYLGDLVDTLIAEAKDESDMFEDVPLDFRHHKFKRRPVFPEGWKLSQDRKKQLEGERERRALEEGKREEEGKVLVGANIIEEAMRAMPVRDDSRVLLEAQQGRRGKGRRMLR
ncbi:small subunit ribosomal protein S35, partial [Lecanoromycetidae sp. Uapishka_2]